MLFLGLVAGPAMVRADDCAGTLAVSEAAPGQITLALQLPCDPYAAVALSYGPIRFVEETGIDGQLALTLPHLAGITRLSVTAADRALAAEVPESAAAVAFIALDWAQPVEALGLSSGVVTAQPLGFPGGLPQARVLPVTSGPVHVDLPVTEATCGTELSLRLHRTNSPAAPLSLSLPPCDRSGETLRLTLDPAG
ncbi:MULTISPECIES: hypothetical protein [unclassified Meridianimarinicoccus]|uniref:hypothetical protein n=1 Tax=unclassified Meridianimarinicoccus TaxID=2923344 RepID=UPI0018688687|nr:hypothetical protein [Fluviibacterium sp. MJW13]